MQPIKFPGKKKGELQQIITNYARMNKEVICRLLEPSTLEVIEETKCRISEFEVASNSGYRVVPGITIEGDEYGKLIDLKTVAQFPKFNLGITFFRQGDYQTLVALYY